MGDLTTNISRHEVACNCGCGFDSIDFKTILIVQSACDYFSHVLGRKCVLDVSSGCRCLAWNDHEDGSEDSQHIYARAIDHSIRGVEPSVLAEYYMSRYPSKYGIGTYKTFVHFDTKTGRSRRW